MLLYNLLFYMHISLYIYIIFRMGGWVQGQVRSLVSVKVSGCQLILHFFPLPRVMPHLFRGVCFKPRAGSGSNGVTLATYSGGAAPIY